MKLKTHPGDSFNDVSKKAKDMTVENNTIVEFEFNGVKCQVSKETNLNWLYRDYNNSWTMGWKSVGPNCVEQYDAVTQEKFEKSTAIREAKAEQQRKEYEQRERKERELVNAAIVGIKLEIIEGKKDEYDQFVATNSKDGYSRGVVDYAEYWAKLMQAEISKGRKVVEVADECQKNLGFLGITGFMYGCAVQALSHFWVHGEELRRWHNKQYGVPEERKGVANPAVFTINA